MRQGSSASQGAERRLCAHAVGNLAAAIGALIVCALAMAASGDLVLQALVTRSRALRPLNRRVAIPASASNLLTPNVEVSCQPVAADDGGWEGRCPGGAPGRISRRSFP